MRALETWSSMSMAYTLGVPPISPLSPSEVSWKFSGQFLSTPSLPATGICLFVLSHVWLFVTPRTIAHQSAFVYGKEYWNTCPMPFPPSGECPRFTDRTHETPAWQADYLLLEPPWKGWRNTSAFWLFRGTVVRYVLQTLKGSLEGPSNSLPMG